MNIKTLDSLLQSRRSIRSYLSHPVEQEKLDRLIEAVCLAPSACNAQPWRLVFVTDPALKKKVADAGFGGVVPNTWAHTAPVLIVACSDLSFFTHKVGEKVQGVHYHLIDMGIALEHLVLKATELELGTCYIGWFKAKPIKKVLNIPVSWNIDCVITLGYPEKIPDATPRKAKEEIAFINSVS